jgi:hypothetical protein
MTASTTILVKKSDDCEMSLDDMLVAAHFISRSRSALPRGEGDVLVCRMSGCLCCGEGMRGKAIVSIRLIAARDLDSYLAGAIESKLSG